MKQTKEGESFGTGWVESIYCLWVKISGTIHSKDMVWVHGVGAIVKIDITWTKNKVETI